MPRPVPASARRGAPAARAAVAATVGLVLAVLAPVAPPPAAAVVGGEEADAGEWPWQVAVLLDGGIWCGGSLVDEAIVLTAAHCTEGLHATDLQVLAGTTDLRSGGELRAVSRIDQHPDFNTAALANDIALLVLDRPVVPSDSVAVIGLATAEESAARSEAGDVAFVTGFGAVDEDGPPSEVLLDAQIDTFDDDRCEALYRQDGDTVFGDTQVCAGREQGSVDACYGDSGGPLVVPVDDERTEWRQIGIVSWGAGCAAPERPTIYTEVSAFADWLEERGVGPGAGERFEGEGARVPARGTAGKASRYPLTIEVPAFAGELDSVSVRLLGLRHDRPEDLDVWLVAPDGTTVTLLSDVGGAADLGEDEVLVVDGAAEGGSSGIGSLVGPTDLEADGQRTGARPVASLAALRGRNPVGTWQLLLADDQRGASGSLDGWSLTLR